MSESPEVEALRREVRRLKGLAVAAALLSVGTLAVAATPATPARQRIEADEFVVRDSSGTVRVLLDKSGLTVNDREGKPRLQSVLNDGTASVILYGPKLYRIHMAVAEDGQEGLYFIDDKFMERARISLQTNDAVGFTLFDRGYKWRAMTAVTRDGTPSFTAFDDKGKVIERLPKVTATPAETDPGRRVPDRSAPSAAPTS